MNRWYDEQHDLTIVFLALPMNVDGVITVNDDCSYTAFINNKKCPDRQAQAYKHALEHIKNGDFRDGNVQEIEKKAHGKEKI